MDNGQELLLYADGKKIANTTSIDIPMSLDRTSDDWLKGCKVSTIDINNLTDYNKRTEFFEYYMRRGDTYYFRNEFGKLWYEAKGFNELLNESSLTLKYGESYEFSYTLTDERNV